MQGVVGFSGTGCWTFVIVGWRMLFVFLICFLAFLDFCDCQVARIHFVFFNTVSGGGFWTV